MPLTFPSASSSTMSATPSDLGVLSHSFSGAASSSADVASSVPRFSGEPGVSHLYLSPSFPGAASSSANVASGVPRFSGEPGVSHLYSPRNDVRGVGRAAMRGATRRGGRATVSTGLMWYPDYSSRAPPGQEDEDELEEQSRSRSQKKSRQN
jgi:hypothetical protein